MTKRTDLCCVSILYAVTLGCSSHDDRQESSPIAPPSSAPSDVSGRPSETGAPAAVVSADASSSSGTSGTADAGSVPFYIDAGLGPTQVLTDPNVSFAWDASATDSRGCEPGSYTGTFQCPFFVAGFFEGDLAPVAEGPITLTLTRSQKGEFLEISGGRLEIWAGWSKLQADILGRLDCVTNKLEGTAVDGTLNESSLLTAGKFEGELSGMLDPARATISGTWNIAWESLDVPGTCNGPFTVSLQP